ncbi:MAG TPA: aminotransferase class V-fold PLP-dependent enzyme [Chitinophagaceae bacterium]|nr:aminotransferase class V-fold PLP-dependent enzyme [Chitinophagaceae bacterium]
MGTYNVLNSAAKNAMDYLEELPGRRVFPSEESMQKLETLEVPLPESGLKSEEVLEILNTIGSVNTVTSNGGRYFGFVFGGTLPASLAASWLVSTWDQNAVFKVSSPIAAQLEKVTANWLLDLLRLPHQSALGFVTGTTMANFCGMVAARHKIYSQLGWDIKTRGMTNAPPIRIIVGEEIHASMQRALMLAGFGSDNLIRVPTDEQGRIIAENFPDLDSSTIVCLQAGNVNTGAIDPLKNICRMANKKGAWVHIDGAFGLWARVSPGKSQLAEGCELADSWAIDLHKWLNVPYDSGLIICKEPQVLQNALAISAAYLPESGEPEPYFHTPEMSRRARGIETWAALNSLGRKGVIDLIERCCLLAEQFAVNLKNAGFRILNEVTLNQVLVTFGDADLTNLIIKKVQEDGTCWCGGTVWKGTTAMRISVSSWMTTEKDIEICSAAIIKIANEELLSNKKRKEKLEQ